MVKVISWRLLAGLVLTTGLLYATQAFSQEQSAKFPTDPSGTNVRLYGDPNSALTQVMMPVGPNGTGLAGCIQVNNSPATGVSLTTGQECNYLYVIATSSKMYMGWGSADASAFPMPQKVMFKIDPGDDCDQIYVFRNKSDDGDVCFFGKKE